MIIWWESMNFDFCASSFSLARRHLNKKRLFGFIISVYFICLQFIVNPFVTISLRHQYNTCNTIWIKYDTYNNTGYNCTRHNLSWLGWQNIISKRPCSPTRKCIIFAAVQNNCHLSQIIFRDPRGTTPCRKLC